MWPAIGEFRSEEDKTQFSAPNPSSYGFSSSAATSNLENRENEGIEFLSSHDSINDLEAPPWDEDFVEEDDPSASQPQLEESVQEQKSVTPIEGDSCPQQNFIV